MIHTRTGLAAAVAAALAMLVVVGGCARDRTTQVSRVDTVTTERIEPVASAPVTSEVIVDREVVASRPVEVISPAPSEPVVVAQSSGMSTSPDFAVGSTSSSSGEAITTRPRRPDRN
jgi:hypothetical protein